MAHQKVQLIKRRLVVIVDHEILEFVVPNVDFLGELGQHGPERFVGEPFLEQVVQTEVVRHYG